jgi:hypothetical protein
MHEEPRGAREARRESKLGDFPDRRDQFSPNSDTASSLGPKATAALAFAAPAYPPANYESLSLLAACAWPVVLNAQWRIVLDPLQCILQQKRGPRRWRDRSFCRSREGLLRAVRENIGYENVDADALAEIRALPPWHADRVAP